MNSFEDHIKRKLRNHSSEIDTDSLWNSISEDIPKEKDRKKRGAFLLFFFGLGMIGGMIFIYSNPYFQNEFSQFFGTNTNTPSLAEDVYYENNMDYPHDDMMPPMFRYHKSDQQDVENQPLASMPIPSTSIPLKNTTAFPNFPLANKEGEINYAGKNNNTFVSTLSVSLSQLQTKKSTIPLEKTAIPTNESLVPVDLLDAEVFAMNDEDIEKLSVGAYEEEEQTEEEKGKVKIAIGFTTGYSSSKSHLSTNTIQNKYYAIKRGKLEAQRGTMTVSGDFVISFPNRMSLRSGVEYTMISEVFSSYKEQEAFTLAERPEAITASASSAFINRDENEEYESTANDSEMTNNANTNVRQLRFQSKNKHHFIDIPLILGYEIGKKKLSLLIESGVNINLRSFSTGYILLADGNYANLRDTDPIFRKNIKMSTYSGLSLNYDLGNKTQLKLGGHLRFNPFSMTRKDNPIKQKYSSTGIHIGILHQL